MIKYILWDIDGTLLDFSLAEEKALRASFKEFDLPWPGQKFLEDYRKINKEFWEKLERKELEKIQVLEGRFYKAFDLYKLDTSSIPAFNKSYQKHLGSVAAFSPYGLEVVLDLKKTYKQFAATNGTITAQKGKLKKSGLDQILDGIFISDQIGYEKPDPRFFQSVLDHVGDSIPEEYIIIGDSLTSDMKLGKNCGIKTIFYNPKNLKIDKDLVDFEISDLRQVKSLIEKINKNN
ncbi:HAD family hydrolase [Neofamilia massiliensis]|uniref:HAD family hydrolase n=1 Tax=Neofamilia massiliensis TaxID=1673724 RepID=UPI0006BB7816|nr:HAD family hydrolase [Neofamilia massiliensis]